MSRAEKSNTTCATATAPAPVRERVNKMQKTTTGLVLRATKTGEADQILSILTPEGIISASAKGSLRLKNKLFSACGLFCYSEFTLFEGKTMYTVDEASVQNVFFGLHEDVESMALAMYCAEIASILSPVGEEAEEHLRLLLNTFHVLCEKKCPPRLVKAAYELRALSQSGFLPDLVACADCVRYEKDIYCFDVPTSRLFCAQCAEKRGLAPNLGYAALQAMRHIVYQEDGRIFSFRVGEESLRQLSAVAEQYVLQCLDDRPRTLPFLQTVLT